MASIFNIAKATQSGPKDEEKTLLGMWTAKADVGVKCTCASFSPNSDYLAIGTDDGSTSVFNPKTGRIMSRLGASYTKQSTLSDMLTDNGRGITMACKFNPAPGKPRLRVALSTGKIELFDVKTGSSMGTNSVEGGQILALDYAKDGRLYACGGCDKRTADNKGHAVRVYDDGTSKLTNTLTGDAISPGHSNRIACVRFKGSSQLATGSLDGTVKLWSTGSKHPIASFPSQGSPSSHGVEDGLFEVAGSSIDFYGDYMLIGSARPHKHLLIYDLRMNQLLSEVFWRKVKPAVAGGLRKWQIAKMATVRPTNVLAAAFADGGQIIAGGSGSNQVKVFTPNAPVAKAYPVGEGDADELAASGQLRDLYSPVASFEVPSGVMGLNVSPKPVIRVGDEIGDGAKSTEDIKLIAVAASNGNVYGVRLPNETMQRPEM